VLGTAALKRIHNMRGYLCKGQESITAASLIPNLQAYCRYVTEASVLRCKLACGIQRAERADRFLLILAASELPHSALHFVDPREITETLRARSHKHFSRCSEGSLDLRDFTFIERDERLSATRLFHVTCNYFCDVPMRQLAYSSLCLRAETLAV
jgi:hypothetical protein